MKQIIPFSTLAAYTISSGGDTYRGFRFARNSYGIPLHQGFFTTTSPRYFSQFSLTRDGAWGPLSFDSLRRFSFQISNSPTRSGISTTGDTERFSSNFETNGKWIIEVPGLDTIEIPLFDSTEPYVHTYGGYGGATSTSPNRLIDNFIVNYTSGTAGRLILDDGGVDRVTSQIFVDSGAFSWVVPDGVTSVEAELVGGGGGGGGDVDPFDTTHVSPGGNGVASRFSTLSVAGGGGGAINGRGGDGGTSSIGNDVTGENGEAGQNSDAPGPGAGGSTGARDVVGLSFYGNGGGGGYERHAGNDRGGSGGGGGGAYGRDDSFTVIPGATISLTVGRGGGGGRGDATGRRGNAGAVRLTWGRIQIVSLSTDLRATGRGAARLTVEKYSVNLRASLRATGAGTALFTRVPANPGEQIIALAGTEYFVYLSARFKLWTLASPQPTIQAGLAPAGAATRSLFTVAILGSGRISLYFTSSDGSNDLSDLFETSGTFVIQTGPLSLTVRMAGMDTSEPYEFLPANAGEVRAFYNALRNEGGGQAGTITLRNFDPTALVVELGANLRATGRGAARLTVAPPIVPLSVDLRSTGKGTARLSVIEPSAVSLETSLRAVGEGTARLTIREAPAVSLSASFRGTGKGTASLTVSDVVTISDWTVPGYQTPIVLALLEATVSGVDLTVDPVTAIEGDLIVANDLTIDGLERHDPPQSPLRLRRSGGGNFLTYFRSNGLYPSAKLWIVVLTSTGPVTMAFSHGASGGGYSNWNLDTASQRATFNAIASGTRFVLAMAEPIEDVDLSVDLRATGKGTASFTIIPTVALSVSLRSTGKGAARLSVIEPPAVNLGTSLRAVGEGTARLSVIEPPAVNLGTSLRATGKGAARLTVIEPSAVNLETSLRVTGKGTARLTVSDVVAISDWTVPGYQSPIVLALLEATVSGVDLTVDPVTAIEGDLVVANDLTIDGLERHDPPQSPLRLRKTGNGNFLTYFRSNGLYPSAKLWIVILGATGPITMAFSHGASGGGYSNWNIDTASQRATFNAIASGTRFVLAMAEPVVDVDLSVDLRSTGKGTARLTIIPAISLSASFRGTGKGTASLTVKGALDVYLSASLRSPGKGTARFTVAEPSDVNLGTSLRATGKGTARLTTRGAAAVSLSTSFRSTGKGTARLTARGASGISLSVSLRSRGKGTARLTARGPSGISLSVSLRSTGRGVARFIVVGPAGLPIDRARASAMSLGGHEPIYALEISHPLITDNVRIVADTVEHTIEGKTYIRLPFRPRVPQDKEGEVRQASIEIDNIGAELMQWVHRSRGGRGASLRVMKVESPIGNETQSAVTWEVTMSCGVTEITNETIVVSLVDKPMVGRPAVLLRHDPKTSPGLF